MPKIASAAVNHLRTETFNLTVICVYVLLISEHRWVLVCAQLTEEHKFSMFVQNHSHLLEIHTQHSVHIQY